MNLEDFEKVDSKKMFQIYDKWPEIAQESFSTDFNKFDSKGIDHVVFAGMGGSGAIGDIFSAILSKTSTHVTVVKGYHLPKTVTSDSVVVVTSISGNTIETISMLKNAIKLNSKIIVFSDGGKIKEICKEKNIPIYERDFKVEDLYTSDEAFVTGTFAGIIPAVNIDDYKISNGLKGKLTHTLQEYYSEKLIQLYPKT